MYIGRYSYNDLLAKATSENATQEDINNLGNWFERYGREDWNGEYYDADGKRLFPVFAPDPEESEAYIFTGNYDFK